LGATAKNFLPARTWDQLTGDGGRAAGLLERECVQGCYLVCPPGSEEAMLQMYCETLQLLNYTGQFPLRPWRHTFTSFLQAEDNPNDFQWRACQENTPAYKQALTRSAPMMALRSVRVPSNDLVKKAREEPAPPPPPAPAPAPKAPATTSAPAARRALKMVAPDFSKRGLATPPPMADSVNRKKNGPPERPAFLDLNFNVNSATLIRLGIFVAALAALLVVQRLTKHHAANPPVEQGSPESARAPKPATMDAPPPKESSLTPSALDGKQLDRLVGDGPTYVLMVPNLTKFSLPIGSIFRFQRLLTSYNRLEALPNEILLEVATDKWDSPPGEPISVRAMKDEHFSAAGPGLECVIDYSGWLANKGPLAVQADFDRVPGAFSMHFGFSSLTNGDPFRLLIINETNPPEPLHLSREFVQYNRQGLRASLDGSLMDCLNTNFFFLDQRQGQLQPWLQTGTGQIQYLYKDWPTGDVPVFGCELDFSNVCQRLGPQREELEKKMDLLREPLGRQIGHWLDPTNQSGLDSFLAFSSDDLAPHRFLTYLDKLKKSAPEKSWIKQWHNKFDSNDQDEVSDRLQNLYNLWCDKRPDDQSTLTVTNAGQTTNYFFYAWQLLKQREAVHDKLDKLQKRLSDLDHVAYVSLFMVNPQQPKPGLEMIRFDKP
jgi:hypothetical protein